jgi:hypothetical protein
MFSIADLQQEHEPEEFEQEGSEDADQTPTSFPIRCSISITKVCEYDLLLLLCI